MMDSAKSFLRGVMDVALVIIPLSVVLGIIFGPSVPFIGTAVVDNISSLSGQKIATIVTGCHVQTKVLQDALLESSLL